MTGRNSLRLRTAEGITFSLPLAGPIRRMLAWVVDLAVSMALGFGLGFGLLFLSQISEALSTAIGFVGFFLVQVGYPIISEWFWRGKTIGKHLLRLRVVDDSGCKLRFTQIVIRNLLRVVDMLPGCYLAGGAACLWSPRSQRLGDIAAGTLVLHLAKLEEPDLEQFNSGKYNSLRNHPLHCHRLRNRLGPAAAGILLESLSRASRLEPSARIRLFSELSAYIRSHVEFPSEAMEGITDEQFVRNTVDVLYHQRAGKFEPFTDRQSAGDAARTPPAPQRTAPF